MSQVQGWAAKPDVAKSTTLILVRCQSTYIGDGADTSENLWVLHDHQRSHTPSHRRSEHEVYLTHILAGAHLAQQQRDALLIFSGGRPTTFHRTEAEGYGIIFQHIADTNPALFADVRYALETYATDSYQNLLFSIIRFRQLTGAYPRDIVLVTYALEARRFLEQHAPALKWPHLRLRVHGIDPMVALDELNWMQRQEREQVYRLFADDPYGARAVLAQNRRARNWDADKAHVFLGYGLEPAVLGLLDWYGGVSGWETYPARLPWESKVDVWR